MRSISLILNLVLTSAAFLQAQQINSSVDNYLYTFNDNSELDGWSKEVFEALKRIELSDQFESRESNINSLGESRSLLPNIDDIMLSLSGLFAQGTDVLKCEACKLAAFSFSKLTLIPGGKPYIINAIGKLCTIATKKNEVVCSGIAKEMGGELYEVFKKVDINHPNVKQMACFALNGMCPSPKFNVTPLKLPARKTSVTQQAPSGKYKYILHLTDLHYDSDYKVGSEASCSASICCHDDTANAKDKNISRPAGIWGDYQCDSPKKLVQSLIKDAAKLNIELNFDMILFTGDIPAHDIWNESEKKSQATEEAAFRFIDSEFNLSKTAIYPSIGNHENVPANQFGIDGVSDKSKYNLYSFLSKQWSNWLPDKALAMVSKGGYYSVQHNKNLKIIVLNNNFCYKYNFQTLLVPDESDPNNMLKWLINELYEAENNNSRVYLTSHIPPGSTDCLQHFSKQFDLIIQRFSHIISSQFYGHVHKDSFQVHYNGTKTATNAISNSYLGPSITTYKGNNPAYRVYKVDASNYIVIDYINYYADIKESSKWTNDAEWKKLYSARELYGKGYSGDYLTPAFWHTVSENIQSDKALFNTFYNLRVANGEPQKECNDKCQANFICNMRAGYSGDGCLVNESL